MATQTLISVEEYLCNISDPDREYVRGVLEGRAVPERIHAAWQVALIDLVSRSQAGVGNPCVFRAKGAGQP